jgi:hypothetical protein
MKTGDHEDYTFIQDICCDGSNSDYSSGMVNKTIKHENFSYFWG